MRAIVSPARLQPIIAAGPPLPGPRDPIRCASRWCLTDLAEINTSVLAAARKLLRADDAVLLLRAGGEDEPARRLRLGDSGELEVVEVSPAQHGADVRALMPRAASRRVHLDGQTPQWLRDMTAIGALAAPITGTDRSVVGALVVTQTKRKAVATFGEADAALLGTLADQASIAIENGMLFRRLEREAVERAHQATHDPLTGCPTGRCSRHPGRRTRAGLHLAGRWADRGRPRLVQPGWSDVRSTALRRAAHPGVSASGPATRVGHPAG